jgi:hypothetical protein
MFDRRDNGGEEMRLRYDYLVAILVVVAVFLAAGATPVRAQDIRVSPDPSEPAGSNSEEDEEEAQCDRCWLVPTKRGWAATLHGGWMTLETLASTFVPPTDLYSEYGYLGIAVDKNLTKAWKVHIDVEGQLIKHIGIDKHWEFAGAALGRWTEFPWNEYVLTHISMGAGLSYATRAPTFEGIKHENVEQTLAYLQFEAAASHPRYPNWAIVFRLHHRSGLFGVFGDAHGASNALGFGVTHRF